MKVKQKRNIIIFFIIFIICLLYIFLFKDNRLYKKIYRIDYSEYVYKYANEYEIDPYLIFAVIKNESRFKEKIVSNSGAIGLMQVIDTTGEEVAKNIILEEYKSDFTLYNAEKNIKIGTKYLSNLIKKYGNNYLLALAAYNAGIGTVDSWIDIGIIDKNGQNIENIPYKETNMYVRKVNCDYKVYKELYE